MTSPRTRGCHANALSSLDGTTARSRGARRARRRRRRANDDARGLKRRLKNPSSHRARDRVETRVADDARVRERPRPRDRVRALISTERNGTERNGLGAFVSVESTTTTTRFGRVDDETTTRAMNVKRRCRLVRTLVRPREAGDATRERTSSSEDGRRGAPTIRGSAWGWTGRSVGDKSPCVTSHSG